jgi:A/G-specific adenine glycosylase
VPHPIVPPVLVWFDTHRRELPWRAADCTPWQVLVSEMMLQQTPVSRVEPVWRQWRERWPGPGDLAAAGHDDVLRAWGRLGYPRRALRLHACAVAVVDSYGGVLPAGEAELAALPGIGPYTAAAVLAFAYGRRSVVLDTNVRRVLARALDAAALPAPHLTAAERARAAAVVPADDATAARWNAAVMELGALVCTARSPGCQACPLKDRCAWLAEGRPADALATTRRRQAWHGTDRQARGAMMAVLRAAEPSAAIPRHALEAAWPDAAQRARALSTLVDDGLVEAGHDGYRLPRGPAGRPGAPDGPRDPDAR